LKKTSDKNLIFNLYSLHGFTGSGSDFNLLETSIQSILDGVSVKLNWFGPNLPGHDSLSDSDCSVKGQYDFLDRYIQAQAHHKHNDYSNFPKGHKNILIAYSMGSRLGLLHATQQTSFWDAIILIGVNPGIRSIEERTMRRESDKILAGKITNQGIFWFLDYWKTLPLIRTQLKTPDDFYQAMQKRKETLDPKGLKNSLLYFGQGVFPDLWDLIPNIQSPILLINGKLDDKYCEISRQFSEIHPNSDCQVIKDCGHAPHIESPLATAQSIVGFLKKYLF
jgi:2-succinyl-6-hydroxy-2,4-cyclohexadiene-1-carboxylate synthase